MIKTFIREDLLSAIKKIYGIEKFSYRGIEKSIYSNESPLLLFTTDRNLMAIKRNTIEKNVYCLEVVSKEPRFGYYYNCDYRECILKMEENETVLIKIYSINTAEYRFPGKAFDFDKEFVIAALENAHKSTPRRGCR